jgi:hypothetical protein
MAMAAIAAFAFILYSLFPGRTPYSPLRYTSLLAPLAGEAGKEPIFISSERFPCAAQAMLLGRQDGYPVRQ